MSSSRTLVATDRTDRELVDHPVACRRQVSRIENLFNLGLPRELVGFGDQRNYFAKPALIEFAEAALSNIGGEDTAIHSDPKPIALDIGIEQRFICDSSL